MFLREWSDPILTWTRQKHFVFFRPCAIHLFISSFLGTYWWEFLHFCIKTTTGSQSIIFPNFGRHFFLQRVFGKKNYQFLDLSDGKDYIFESQLYSRLGNAIVFAPVDGTPISNMVGRDIFGLFFCGQFSSKERKVLNIFERDLIFPIVHCSSLLWHWWSKSEIKRSICFLLSCINEVLIDEGRNFLLMKVFRWQVFCGNKWELKFIQSASVTLSGPKIPCMVSQWWLCDGIWNFCCIQLLAGKFLIFPQDFGSKISRGKFSKKIPPLSTVWRAQCAPKWCIILELKNIWSNM